VNDTSPVPGDGPQPLKRVRTAAVAPTASSTRPAGRAKNEAPVKTRRLTRSNFLETKTTVCAEALPAGGPTGQHLHWWIVDVWHPSKLRLQSLGARAMPSCPPAVTCRSEAGIVRALVGMALIAAPAIRAAMETIRKALFMSGPSNGR